MGRRYCWRNAAGQLHRDNNLPAVIWDCGTCLWYQKDKLHRDDGPAVIRADGTQIWYKDGKKHRIDGPAVITVDSQMWYQDDKLHRIDGPAVIQTYELYIWLDHHAHVGPGEEWYQHGELHRIDGPARVFADGGQEWYQRNKRHRDGDLPAIIKPNGMEAWYLRGYLRRINGGPPIRWPNGDRQIIMISRLISQDEWRTRRTRTPEELAIASALDARLLAVCRPGVYPVISRFVDRIVQMTI